MERSEYLNRLHRSAANLSAVADKLHVDKRAGGTLIHTPEAELALIAIESLAHLLRYGNGGTGL